jgi:multiple sugar transport system substrate-binding protein
MAWGNPEQMALEQTFCEEFNEKNPDIHVKFVAVPQSAYVNKAVVMLASRTAPDLVRIDHYNFPNLVRKGFFFDLAPLAAKDPSFKFDDFFPLAMSEGSYQGGFYGLNQGFGAEIVYYNKTMVQQAGLEDPYELYQQGRWTWDRFREYAMAMTRKGPDGHVTQFGCAIPQFPMNVPLIWAFGGDLLSPDGQRSRLGEPGAAQAFQFLADLIWIDHAAPTPAQDANSAFVFESGKLGMRLDWMGMAPRYRSAAQGFEWDICPIPKGPFGGTTIVKGNQLVVSKESAHPEAAWRFERFLTSKEIETKLYIDRRRNFPTRKDVAFSPEFLKTKLPPFNTKAYLQDAADSRSMPIDPRWSEWSRLVTNAQDDLFSGRERNAEVALKKAASNIDALLADEEGF